MASLLRFRGLLTADSAAAYSTLRGLTAGMRKDTNGIVWHLRVLAVMLGVEMWRQMPLTVQFSDETFRSLALAHAAAPVPRGFAYSTVGALNLPPAAAPTSSKRKREEVIVVD
jgi:hypothetical protein